MGWNYEVGPITLVLTNVFTDVVYNMCTIVMQGSLLGKPRVGLVRKKRGKKEEEEKMKRKIERSGKEKKKKRKTKGEKNNRKERKPVERKRERNKRERLLLM
jgi:hypothetical protein